MPLPKPSLDNRSFAQINDECRSLLPEVAPAWTDHNVSNTGITLQELLAWLCEMDLYRLDRVTDEAIRGFLRLLGIEPLPVQPAQAVLSLQADVEMPLPAGLQLAAPARAGVPSAIFQTTQAITTSKARLTHVLTGDNIDVTGRNDSAVQPYFPFGANAEAGAVFHLGFDAPLAAPGTTLQMHAWTPDPVADASTRANLIADHEAALREREQTCPSTLRQLSDWWLHYQVRTRWEYFAADLSWKPLPDCVDETRALCLSGFIRFTVPADHAAGAIVPGMFHIRCRVLRAGFECPKSLAAIAINAVAATHAADVSASLGRSHGRAVERYPLPVADAIPGSGRLLMQSGAGTDAHWTEVREWDLSGPHDRHFRLDRERSQLELGDGRRGAVAAAAATLELHYQVGGGPAGNLPPRTLERWLENAHNNALVPAWPTLPPDLRPRQLFACHGGRAADSLKSTVARAIAQVQSPSAVMTLDDYEQAACRLPAVPVARARAIRDREPSLPCFRASGDIAVVVIPDCDGPRPTPSDGMRAAVLQGLSRRRSPATRLHVIAPDYHEVTVVATLNAQPDADSRVLKANAITAIDDFLHPLRGASDGRGWPVGHTVHRSEVFALLASLPGVASVTGLGLQGAHDREPRCANLPLCDDQLPAPGRHCISVVAAPELRIIDRSHPHECP